jgi:uncharacterized repeat protein (TIGR02543 family)/prepilin-type N-terminal cleavage/methylation domain-containing protein
MKRKRSGMTLVEVIVAMALLGIMSVSLIGGFPSQLVNINKGRDITVQALDEQAGFEDVIYNVKTMIKNHNPGDSLDPLVSAVPEWNYETVQILGQGVVMQKLTRTYADVAKDNTIYLSRRLAEKEKYDKLPMSGVMIDVSTDADNKVADLSLSPLPELTAVHDDNTNEPDFYVNLYRWWRSNPGKDLASLIFPDDFTMLSISQTTDVLKNLLDNVGAGRYVALTVTPVDINGHRGNTMLSSNYVFIKGGEWRVGPSPWADTDNNYNLDTTDVIIDTQRIQESLDAAYDSIPDQVTPTNLLSIQDSSLFVPMKIDSGGGSIPGDIPVEITGTEVIDWTFENNINMAKDFEVLNGTDVNIRSGSDGDGGSIYLYPYVELDVSGNPVYVGGAPKIINYGTSIVTDGNIYLKTLNRGDIELLNHNGLAGNYINLEARGSISINNSTLTSDNDIVLDTMKNLAISGDRSIELQSAVFSSVNSNRKIQLDAGGDILFKGGGWSSNQTLYIPNGKNILFEKAAAKVINSGPIDVGSTGRMYFKNSMAEDLTRPLKIRLEKDSDDSFELTTINYIRNVNYASPSSNQQVSLAGLWTRLGTGTQNFEFSTRVISGPGDVTDLEYSFEGNGIIRINVAVTDETAETKIKFDVRDRYNSEIIGSGYFEYSVDAWGNPSIEVEEPPPLNYYTITFNTNGGSEIGPRGGYAGDSVGTVDAPVKTGYNFLGWDKPVPDVIPEYDLELNAIWQPIIYTITFDSGWTGNISPIQYQYGDNIYIPNPSRPGYNFGGWNWTPPATMPADNLHFVATWTQKELTVTFNANGGTSPTPATRQVFYDSAYGPLAVTSRAGYTFTGWYTGSSNGTLVESTTRVQNPDNHELFAHWVAAYQALRCRQINPTDNRNSFTLTFNNNIDSIDSVSGSSLNTGHFSRSGNTVTYNRSNANAGDYSVTVSDIYGQQLRVDLRLTRHSFLWWEWWDWSASPITP